MASAADLLRQSRMAQLNEIPDADIAKATRVDAANVLRQAREKGLIPATTQYAGVAA